MKTSLIATFALLLVSTASAQSVIVLKTSTAPSTPDRHGLVTVTLASGNTITISASDIDGALTASMATTTSAAPAPSAGGLTPPLTKTRQQKCAADHATDFQLRAFCEKQQAEAEARLRGRSMSGGNHAIIRTSCAKDWPDDALMRDYCETQQLKALGTLGLPR